MASRNIVTNGTTFILPQWLLPKEPGMNCRSHGTIIGMLALYNIISTVLSVVTAGPFFVRQKQQLWSLTSRASSRCWGCVTRRRDRGDAESGNSEPDPDYLALSFWSFAISVLGSVAISLSAPLLTGILISKSHPNANRWVLVEQWSTRPRAALFVIVVNLIAAGCNHWWLVDERSSRPGPQQLDGYLETSITAIATELVVSFFGIKFLWDQTDIPSPDEFPSSKPCTYFGSPFSPGNPSNCPDMQIGAYGLVQAIIFNGLLSIVFLISLYFQAAKPKAWLVFLCCLPLTTFVIYMYSWEIWANFLHSASDDLYCIEASVPIDVIYCLLPVLLGLWRLAWSGGRKYRRR